MNNLATFRRMAFHTGLFTAFTLFAGCSSCTDDPSNPNNAPENTENNRMQMEAGQPPANGKLVHVESSCTTVQTCNDDVTFNSGRKVQAQLLDGEGNPVSNVNVTFDIEGMALNGSAPSARQARTNEQGIAEIQFNAGMTSGVVKLKIATEDPNINVLYFLITVNPKDASSFNVDFTKIGDTDVRRIEVFLFDENETCDSFLNGTPGVAEWTETGEASSNGDLPTIPFAGIPNNTTYTVGARAYDRTNDNVEIAAGCMPGSMNPRIMNGMPVTVTVPLLKHIPYMVGDYDVVHDFSLIDAFPPNVARIVNLVGTLVSDQGAFIVGCGEENMTTGELEPTADCPVPTEGIAALLVDALPEDGALGQLRETIESFLDSGFAREVARQTINDAVNDFIDTNSNVPSWVKDGLNITEDVYSNLKNFRVEATLRINEQPTYLMDAEGIPMANANGELIATWGDTAVNEHIWQDIILFWRFGCDDTDPPDCGQEVYLDPNDVSTTDAVEGVWNGTVEGNTIFINEHALSFNYGTFVLQLLERLVLPELFGDPTINSVEAGLDSLIMCAPLAEQVADATISGVEGIFNTLCEQLKDQATDALRSYVEDLVFEGSDRFTIGSPEGKPCTFYFPEVYQGEWPGTPLPYVEKFGEITPNRNKLCDWDVKVKLSEDSEAVVVGGSWTGEREQ